MIRTLTRLATTTGIALATLSACAFAEPADTLAPDKAIEDLDRLYSGLQSGHANLFAATPKAVFDAEYEALRERYTAPVSLSALHKDFQQFAALAHHGHTRINSLNPGFGPYVEGGGKVFPLRLSIVDGQVIVAGAPAGSGIEPGDRIRSLNGEPNPIWLSRILKSIPAETPALAYSIMSGGEYYYVWLAYGPQDTFTLGIERGGEMVPVTLDAVEMGAMDDLVQRGEAFSLDGREAAMLGDRIAYLRPGPFFNTEAASEAEAYSASAVAEFTAFIDAAFESFNEAGATDLILDLRDNPGGTNSFSDPVIAWFADEPFRFASDFRIRISADSIASNAARLEADDAGTNSTSAELAALYETAEPGAVVSYDLPYAEPRDGERFEGAVHVLVNRYSYSNAVNAAAIIQDYGFGTIYGEPTRDMATTYGAMEQFTLPNSGFPVGYPKAHIIRPNGEERSEPVTPDIRLPWPDVRGDEDVMLDALVERLREK